MTAVAEQLKAGRPIADRPDHYEQLLLEPIADGEGGRVNAFGSYAGWEADHWSSKRFYVAGLSWLQNASRLNQGQITEFREKANSAIQHGDIWRNDSEPAVTWDREFGKPQLHQAFAGKPISFANAAKIILACELALEELLRSGRAPERLAFVQSAGEIYRHMAIVPAVYNIDNFCEPYIKQAESTSERFYSALMEQAKLRGTAVIHDLAAGGTVTHATAKNIRDHAPEVPAYPLGRVRAKPGRHLGKGSASIHEEIDFG